VGCVSVDTIRTAYESLAAGDVEPLVSLIHPEMEWRGRRSLRRLWQPPPS
jgi:ketosteroid isomerase-like protein